MNKSKKFFESLTKKRESQWFKSDYKPIVKIAGPLNEEKIKMISEIKNEPKWMLKIRLKAFKHFKKLPYPKLEQKININFNKIIYYGLPDMYTKPKDWKELPNFIKETYLKLNLDKFLVNQLQFDSSIIFRKLSEKLKNLGVIFTSLDEAIIEYKNIVKKYFGKLVSYKENKFAALNTAVWSGGVFIYIPKDVKLKFPLHTYFRINLKRLGQFERTLIIADKNSEMTYIEGCSSPIYSLSNLHLSIVEVFALENSAINYITLQNWSRNVYNLPTKRAIAKNEAKVKWISLNIGSKITISYPSIYLENNARGEILTITFAGKNQIFDTGGKIVCNGKNCRGIINSKGIAIENGKIFNRIEIIIPKKSENCEVHSKCDGLIFDCGKFETIPKIKCLEKSSYFNHEGEIQSIDKEKLFYLKSKGIKEENAIKLMIFGFIDNILRQIPDFFRLEIEKILNIEIER